MKRIQTIDVLRGLVMIIMVLDHTRHFFHSTAILQQPTDLATTNFYLFFTRWITHLCAPTFVFLSGVSAYLNYQKTGDRTAFRKHLLLRGLWLILLDFSLIGFGLWFDVYFKTLLFNVVASIGFGFLILSFVLKLSPLQMGLTGISILCLQHFISYIPLDTLPGGKALSLLFVPGAFPIPFNKLFIMSYPPIPWFGVMLLGFSTGTLIVNETIQNKLTYVKIALVSLSLFVVLRAINIYGDAIPWSIQQKPGFTILSFINLTKYPPSLQFCLLFLGIMFLLFYFFEGRQNTLTQILQLYGRVPLFYFVIHWYILHALLFVVAFSQGYRLADLEFGTGLGRPKEWTGFQLPAVYFISILVVLIMNPLCRWYYKYRTNR